MQNIAQTDRFVAPIVYEYIEQLHKLFFEASSLHNVVKGNTAQMKKRSPYFAQSYKFIPDAKGQHCIYF